MSGRKLDPFVDATRRFFAAAMRRSMHEALARTQAEGLSTSQVGALFLLHDRGVCTVGEIAHAVGITMGGATQLVDRLVLLGHVDRREDPENRRSKRVALTEHGAQVMTEIMNLRKDWITHLAASIKGAERLEATRLIERMTRLIEGDDER